MESKLDILFEELSKTISISNEITERIKYTSELFKTEIIGMEYDKCLQYSDKLISGLDDIAWLSLQLSNKKSAILRRLKEIRDPEITRLNRQGRSSFAVIESEVRFNNEQVAEYEEQIETLQNSIEYFKLLVSIIDKKLFMAKDYYKSLIQ